MATSPRLRGNVNPIFTLKLDEGAATSYADDLKETGLDWEDRDDSDLTFWEAAQGILQEGTLTLRSVLSWAPGSLCRFAWDNAGKDLDVVWGPWGNAVPTGDKPHFTGTASFTSRPPLSNTAKASSDVTGAEFEIDLKFSTDVTVDDGA